MCEECENVRYIRHIGEQKVREQSEESEVFEVDREKKCKIEIPNMGRVNRKGKRAIRTNAERP